MSTKHSLRSAVRLALRSSQGKFATGPVTTVARCAILTGAAAAAVTALPSVYAQAQDNPVEELVITGTRIRQPGVVSSSPIYSIGAEEIERQQEPELEKILRLLPVTAPSDGQNVNNGTQGAATIDLRGMGSQRTLVMMNGRRMVPFNDDGEVDTSMIPTALIERVDIITGGASAVYGSDAIAGAVNVVLRDDFEGVDVRMNTSQTGESDGQDYWAGVTLGTNAADGAANFVVSLGYQERDPILLGARPLGQLGITTASGANYSNYLAGIPPAAPVAGCGGPEAVSTGGSTTTVPTRVAIAGGPALGQFREDGTLGANCSEFNFNPYNYYQTPLKRYNGTLLGHIDVSDSSEVYSMFNYGKTDVRQQVAPSGVFGTGHFTPLSNPLIGAQARAEIIRVAELGRQAGTVNPAGVLDLTTPNPNDFKFNNWTDTNGNGIVDAPDQLQIQYRRRTGELGTRSEDYNNEMFQAALGLRGELTANWDYDMSFSYGETNRVLVRGGYTNLANFQNALQTTDGVTCANGQATCVPINVFGGYGTITPAMAAYSGASAIQEQTYDQLVGQAFVTGSFEKVHIPSASDAVAFSFGIEHRDEGATLTPDECLKLAPSSCLGGAGGYFLPIDGGFRVNEAFMEALVPLVDGKTGVQGLDLEIGYRYSDYTPSGSDDTWKFGVNYRPIESLLFRAMQQRAARAPNVDELASPTVSGLDNAPADPCSIANAANNGPGTALRDLCISTGMSAAQVGTVENIVSGQVNIFEGTDLANLPTIEQADTTTVGFVWTPDLGALLNPVFSLDYYNIDIANPIDDFSPGDVINACYQLAIADECAKVKRVGGTLTLGGAGIMLLTRNKVYSQAEGVELGFNFGFNVGMGDLMFSGTANKYLTHEYQSLSALPVVDCNGFFGTNCENVRPDFRMIERTTWNLNNLSLSAQLRHIGAVSVEPIERAGVYTEFRDLDSETYVDLYASYRFADKYLLSFGAMNVTDIDPPVVGNEAASTSFNSGNTFPSTYDVLGPVYTLQLSMQF